MRGRAQASCAAIVLLASSSGSACATRLRPLDGPDRWRTGECVARFTLEHHDSPLAELRALGGWRDDFQARFPAAIIDPATQHPVTATVGMQFEGRPIAWFAPTLDAVVLDGAAFAPLRRVDATRAVVGERTVVGRVVPRARAALGDRGVLELLLRIDAIQSYWHRGADLCLTSEHEDEGAYQAELHGVHQYLADRDREASLAFAVEIDPEGEIAVIGREAP